MTSKRTTTTTIRIRIDQIEEIDRTGLNLSEFVRDKLDEEFDSNDFLNKKEKELMDQLANIKERKGNFKDKTQKEYDSERNKFFKEAKKIIARDPNFLRGQWDRYKNLFGDRITIEKFREIIEEW